MMQPTFEYVFEVHLEVGERREVLPRRAGGRGFGPIIGGTIQGPGLRGRVVPGGADWPLLRPDGVLVFDAKYLLESHDGHLIQIHNRGIRRGSPDVMSRLRAGERIDPAQYYFITTPMFEAADDGPYAWLNDFMFVGKGMRRPEGSIIEFYKVS